MIAMQVLKDITLMGGVGYDSNIYIIDGEVIVDTGTGLFFPEIKEEIDNRFDKKKIRSIVNTHCHYDHTGGNKSFRDWLKAELLVHEEDKKAAESGEGTLSKFFEKTAKVVTMDKALRAGQKIKTKNFSFDVLHTPGHSPGSICLYDRKNKILISGDTLFEDGIGRTDLPGGNKKDMFSSLEKLSKLQINVLLPGHGMPKMSGVNFFIKQMLAQQKQSENF